jgi:hypothetical protein
MDIEKKRKEIKNKTKNLKYYLKNTVDSATVLQKTMIYKIYGISIVF